MIHCHSLNCSRVVPAILSCVTSDLAHGSEDPPNSVTSVNPGPRLMAVRECPQQGFCLLVTCA